jgi:hypothetical protein
MPRNALSTNAAPSTSDYGHTETRHNLTGSPVTPAQHVALIGIEARPIGLVFHKSHVLIDGLCTVTGAPLVPSPTGSHLFYVASRRPKCVRIAGVGIIFHHSVRSVHPPRGLCCLSGCRDQRGRHDGAEAHSHRPANHPQGCSLLHLCLPELDSQGVIPPKGAYRQRSTNDKESENGERCSPVHRHDLNKFQASRTCSKWASTSAARTLAVGMEQTTP